MTEILILQPGIKKFGTATASSFTNILWDGTREKAGFGAEKNRI